MPENPQTAIHQFKFETQEAPILQVEGLKTFFYSEEGVARAVDGVSFQLSPRETLGVVGESGCGKSVMALSVLRLIPQPPGKIVGGEIFFKEQRLLSLPMDQMRGIRGKEISMIFQEPMTALNPVFTVGRQIAEVLTLHEGLSRTDALEKTIDMLKLVGIPSPEKRVRDYPHQLSGGMRQRVMIAMALACNPSILIADEPTTALDVTIQAQILRLIRELQQKLGMAVLLITHDLGVVAETAQRIIVMYMGKIVEQGEVKALFHEPLHPYTQGLLRALPNFYKDSIRKDRLEEIPGMVESLLHPPSGCYFSPRCRSVMEICRTQEPLLEEISPGRSVRCWLHRKGVNH
jgi:oligopeptide/dipeptide ABC transporter ATP-binding protein